ncbi:MAG: hypothetical protein U9O85_02730 [Euryarchaeota archaeon]|nr:hypothetical protein [Euryarchaeota archaeon]
MHVFIQALSGNASDKNHFREIVKEYKWCFSATDRKPKKEKMTHSMGTGCLAQRWNMAV